MPTQRPNYLVYSLLKQGCPAKDFCELSDLSRRLSRLNALCVPPAGIEPAHQPSEGCALSPELRGRMRKVISACMNTNEVREFRDERTYCIFCNWLFLGCRKTILESRWSYPDKRWLYGRNDCQSFLRISLHRQNWTYRIGQSYI